MQTPARKSRRRMLSRPVVSRQGVAATEFAVVLPVVVLIVFGGLSAAHLVTLKHNAKLIADGAIVAASQPDTNFADVEKRFEALASSVGIRGMDVRIENISPNTIRVETTIPVVSNNPLNSFSPTIRQISAESFIYRSPPDF